jgi:uncharacterized protein (TIGR00255 family)
MTGFGRGAVDHDDVRVIVEIRTVNHRFLDLKLRGAPSPAVEELLAVQVRERIERGAVTATIKIETSSGAGGPRLDVPLARRVFADLTALAIELGTSAPGIAEVMRVPGVVTTDDGSGHDVTGPMVAATRAALDAVCAHRDAEGARLAVDLKARASALRELFAALTTAAEEARPIIFARLRDRIDKALAPGVLPPERLAQEVALLVDRTDVTEELVRARSHMEAVADSLVSAGPVGRRLDFLLQELGREINTTGAKSATATISALVVQGKAELEKMREQVQNLE